LEWFFVHRAFGTERKSNMGHGFKGTALLLALVLPALAADNAGNRGNQATKPSDADYDALAQAKEVVGVILKVDGSDKGFTLKYQYQYLVPNPKAIDNANRQLNRQQQQILRQYNQALRTKNPIQQAQKLQRVAIQAQNMGVNTNNLYTAKTGRKDFDLQAIEEVKVRVTKPPVEYDEKGNVKEYTKKELKELKGKDSSLPGYTASWDNVSVGQTVKVYFKSKKKKKDKDKDKDKEDKADDKDKKKKDKADAPLDDDDHKPVVRMIVIMKEPDSDNRPMKGKDK
jgi:hypothetical protein